MASVKSVPNPAVIWMAVFIGGAFLSWLFVASKTGKMRYWWLGLIALLLSGGLIFLTKDKRAIVTYRAPRDGYQYQKSPYLPSSPYRGY